MRFAGRTKKLDVTGTVQVPGDKSISHRALMFAALANGPSRIRGLLESADIMSTAAVLRACGCDIPPLTSDFVVHGKGVERITTPQVVADCGNSGTTVRLMMGIIAGRSGVTVRFDGDASLRKRPMKRVTAPLSQMGARFEYAGGEGLLPLTVLGRRLKSIDFHSEHASAQVKSAVLLAALTSGVEASVHEPAMSRDHTERMLAARGVALEVLANGVRIAAGQTVSPCDTQVPGDPSSAAFFAALAALADSGTLRLTNVCLNPGRTGFLEVLAAMGASLEVVSSRVSGGETVGDLLVSPGALNGVSVGGDLIPRSIDELPLLACLAARATGETRIVDAAELRVKESDRIGAVVANLKALGVDAEELASGMVVRGSEAPLKGHVKTHGDHRLAMAFGVLAACPENEITIDDRDCASVSYPGFWQELSRLTGGGGTTRSQAPRLVIAIDGPAASGKSSTAQWVSRLLGVRHIDSGALYRALTWLALERGTPEPDLSLENLLEVTQAITLQENELTIVPVIGARVAGDELRSQRVTEYVSRVASISEVREWVNELVRSAARSSDVVVDGRDIGTAIFPDATLKIFLEADPWERARRRLVQRLNRTPSEPEIADETEALVARDARDATQSIPARDAITINTTSMTQEEQVKRIVVLAEAARKRLGR